MRGGEHCIGLSDFGLAEVVIDIQSGDLDDIAASVFADWIPRRAG
jgi:hypothetical protein